MKANLQMIAVMDRPALRGLSERDFSVAIREYAEARGWKVEYRFRSAVKLSSGRYGGTGPPGFPDLFLARGPEAIAAELKTEAGRATAEQQEWLRVLENVSGITAVLWRPRDAATIIRRLG